MAGDDHFGDRHPGDRHFEGRRVDEEALDLGAVFGDLCDVDSIASRLVAGDAAQIESAAIAVSLCGAPELSAAQIDAHLETLAAIVAEPTSAGVTAALFHHGGLKGNRDGYYDADNSLLGRVLARSLGNPIMLATVTLAVARRVGLEWHGVGMPMHFLVGGVRDSGDQQWCDPFAGGRGLSAEGAQGLFRSLGGSQAQWQPQFLNRTPPVDVARRILNNLVAIHGRDGDLDNLAWVAEARARLGFDRQLGLARAAERLGGAGAFDSAGRILDALGHAAGTTDEGDDLRRRAAAWWARLN